MSQSSGFSATNKLHNSDAPATTTVPSVSSNCRLRFTMIPPFAAVVKIVPNGGNHQAISANPISVAPSKIAGRSQVPPPPRGQRCHHARREATSSA